MTRRDRAAQSRVAPRTAHGMRNAMSSHLDLDRPEIAEAKRAVTRLTETPDPGNTLMLTALCVLAKLQFDIAVLCLYISASDLPVLSFSHIKTTTEFDNKIAALHQACVAAGREGDFRQTFADALCAVTAFESGPGPVALVASAVLGAAA